MASERFLGLRVQQGVAEHAVFLGKGENHIIEVYCHLRNLEAGAALFSMKIWLVFRARLRHANRAGGGGGGGG